MRIGFLDSGVGGFSVLFEVHRRAPELDKLYLADTAHFPFGPRPGEEILAIVGATVRFLQSKGAEALVLACNSSSSVTEGLSFPIPVLGLIEHGAKAALSATRSGRIGVIATEGTIRSGSYDRWLHRLGGPSIYVRSLATPLLAPLVESGRTEGRTALAIVSSQLSPLLAEDIDVLLLGCTHYPFLNHLLREILPEGVTLVDPASGVAELVRNLYQGGKGSIEYYVTGPVKVFEKIGRKILGTRVRAQRVALDLHF
ncbi:MAG: glutamate racemase [Bacillota bacterium]